MKRIGIITINSPLFNYGNLLQKYAIQRILNNIGYESELIVDLRYNKDNRSVFTYYKSFIHFFSRIRYVPSHHKRDLLCYLWSRKHIKSSSFTIKSKDDESKLIEKYDSFVVGSDVVWNPHYYGKFSYMNFLEFAKYEQRIAYAPSFGVDKIPETLKDAYKHWLENFIALSSREERGCQIIKELTGRDAELLLDPTIALPPDVWDEIALKGPKFRYVFVYILGEIDKYKKYVEKCAKDNNCSIINIHSDKKYAGCNPGMFVGLIKSSTMVITDSFHGSIFALIYHRPLTILKRTDNGPDLSSRLENLVNIFKLKGACADYPDIREFAKIEWGGVDEILNEYRVKQINYLKRYLP